VNSPNLLRWLDEVITPSLGAEARLQLLVSTLLIAGSKSYSHTLVLFDRYKALFASLATDESAQAVIVAAVCSVWKNSSQHMIVILDKLLTMRLIDAPAIVDWVFTQKPSFHMTYVWEILHNTVHKSLRRVELTEKELKNNAMDDDEESKTREELDRIKRELFLSLFRGFCGAVEDLLKDDQLEAQTQAALDRMKATIRMFSPQLQPYMNLLETSIFTDAPSRVADLFAEIKQSCAELH